MGQTTPKLPAVVIALSVGWFAGLPAQAQSGGGYDWSAVIVVSAMPSNGTFMSMERKLPPLPFDPLPSLELYTEDLASGVYWYDDRGVDYGSLLNGGGGVHADDFPSPPGTNFGGGGSGPLPIVMPTYTVTSNCQSWTNFWLVISNTGTAALVGIESTLPGTYYTLQTNADLSTTNWGVYAVMQASNSLTWADPVPFSVATNLFFRAAIIWPTVLWVTSLPCTVDEWGYGLDASPSLRACFENGKQSIISKLLMLYNIACLS